MKRTRRNFLAVSAAAAAGAALPWARAATPTRILRAGLGSVAIAGSPHPMTGVWSYDGDVPGPELRFKQGERLRVELENRLPDPTTVHWHGLRLPNAMDGVPHLTQPPVKPDGGRFVYEFGLQDAGTFWYHPHLGSPEQVGRGLYGALIVEEHDPIAVDRDVVWMLGDWRLDREARIVEDFRSFMDASHAGRIGNTVTINGRVQEVFEVRPGERIRLRLANAANARIFGLDFRGHRPLVIAQDGHAIEPHAPEGGRIVLGPGMRADVILDATGDPGSAHTVVDDFYPRQAYRLIELRYANTRARGRAGTTLTPLPANPLSEPVVADAARQEIRFEGGMMGRMPMGGRMPTGRTTGHAAAIWSINGQSVPEGDHRHEPLLRLDLGRSYVLDMINDTAWHHPIHLHGHVFRVVSRDGRPPARREWADTVLLAPRSRAEIAFVADNPGNWMLHCHVLEHQASGMMAVVKVG
jgi:FtsP/CotA-like multicopper oxidase with cupredoxin domain